MARTMRRPRFDSYVIDKLPGYLYGQFKKMRIFTERDCHWRVASFLEPLCEERGWRILNEQRLKDGSRPDILICHQETFATPIYAFEVKFGDIVQAAGVEKDIRRLRQAAQDYRLRKVFHIVVFASKVTPQHGVERCFKLLRGDWARRYVLIVMPLFQTASGRLRPGWDDIYEDWSAQLDVIRKRL